MGKIWDEPSVIAKGAENWTVFSTEILEDIACEDASGEYIDFAVHLARVEVSATVAPLSLFLQNASEDTRDPATRRLLDVVRKVVD